jgi:hypothetical protein
VQEVLPRSTKQEDDLGTPNATQKRQKKLQVDPMWVKKAWGIKFTPSSFPHFSISFSLFKSSCSSIFETVLSIYRIKENWKGECASQRHNLIGPYCASQKGVWVCQSS